MLKYLANLRLPMMVLWCYLLWYLLILAHYFQREFQLWLTAFGLALIVGLAHNLNVKSDRVGGRKTSPWVVFRFYLIPFCVSSFAGLVKGKGFVMIFSPTFQENLTGGAICLVFLALVWLSKHLHHGARNPPRAV